MTLNSFKFPETLGRKILWLWLIAFVALILKSLVSGTFGVIGTDSDDIMRLVQIRDLYAGQSWFDMTQTRMGPEGGTLMHWSRLVDLPITVLIGFFDLFLPYAAAETVVITVWPPLTALLVVWGVMTGAKHMGGGRSFVFAAVLLLFLLIPHYRFSSGSIDHHNLQLGLLAIVLGYALDPEMKARSFALSGIALALSIAIGAEVNVFIAVICGFFGVNWLVKGAAARRGSAAFGIGFAGTLVLVFVTTIAPRHYGVMACDTYSAITLILGGAGGTGLAILALFLSDKSWAKRLGGAAILGVCCAALLMGLAPQCLSNPLDALPPEAKTLWLDHVIEAQPLFGDKTQILSLAPYILGPTLLALFLAVRLTLSKTRPVVHGFLAVLLLTAAAMSVYQVRFNIFGGLFALFILPAWIAGIYERTRAISEKDVTYILALAASIPFVWGFPGLMLTPVAADEGMRKAQAAACYSPAVLEVMAALPAGRFAATSNATSPILKETEHSALSGNYHRNTKGIVINIHALTHEPERARIVMREHNVNYVHVCRTTEETRVFKNYNPDGLIARLVKREAPDFMEPIGEDLEDGAVTLYRVTAP